MARQFTSAASATTMTRQLELAVIGLLLFVWVPHQTALAQGQADLHDMDDAGQKLASRRLNVKLVSANSRDAYQNPEAALDGDPATEFTFVWGNGGAEIVLDLREPTVVESLEIVSGPTGGPFFLSEVNVGPDPSRLQRDLLHRGVNLVVVLGQKTRIPLVPAVSRYLRLFFSGGGKVGIGEISVHGRPHRPERHLCHWWSGDVKTDFLDALDYLDRDLQATDVWIDKVVTAFSQHETESWLRGTGSRRRFPGTEAAGHPLLAHRG